MRRQGDRGAVAMTLWMLRYPLRRWSALLVVLGTMVAQIGLTLLGPWPMKLIVDNVLSSQPLPAPLAGIIGAGAGGPDREALLLVAIAATVLLFVLTWALGVAAAFAKISFGQRMVYDLAADLFAHLQRLSLRFHSRNSVGDTMRRVTEDCGSVATVVEGALLPTVASVISLVAMFLVMWQLSAPVTLLALGAIPLMFFALVRYSEPMAQRSYVQQEVEGEVYEVVEQTLSAIPVVQAFGAEERADRRFRAVTTATLEATLAATDVQFRFKILLGLATALGTAAILWIGAHQVLSGALSIGGLLVFLAYLGQLYGHVESLVYAPASIREATGSGRRVMEVLDAEPEVADAPGAWALPPVVGHVRLEDVTFGYETGRPVLRGVTLEARPGEVVALVGATGAGKSTLVGLVPRFNDPWTGRVTIDGHDLRDVRLRSLREQVALVLQEPFLFPLTIAENIAYGRPDATREEIEAAATAANAHAFISRLPEGYDTLVGERGATLSGGERQRLSIARALLKDAPILILDEPTSALDAETEALLLDALERLMAGRTTFIIAHRLSTIRRADRIAVLRDGQIVEQGRHGELLAHKGAYARLHDLQFGSGDEPATMEAPSTVRERFHSRLRRALGPGRILADLNARLRRMRAEQARAAREAPPYE